MVVESLLTIFNKPMAPAPNRIKQMMQRYSLGDQVCKSSKLVLSNTLSSNIDVKKGRDEDDCSELWYGIENMNALDEVYMQTAVLDRIQRETQQDDVLQNLKTSIMNCK